MTRLEERRADLVRQIKSIADDIEYDPERPGDVSRLGLELEARNVRGVNGGRLWSRQSAGDRLMFFIMDYIPELVPTFSPARQRAALIREIADLAEQIDFVPTPGGFTKLASELNERRIVTASGGEWSTQNIQFFVKRHMPDLVHRNRSNV